MLSSNQGDAAHSSSYTSFSSSAYLPAFLSALEVLQTMTEVASSFLSRRFEQDVWPLLATVMKFEQLWLHDLHQYYAMTSSSSIPSMNDRMQNTLQFKTLKCVLLTLAQMSRFPDLAETHIWAIAEHCRPYLSQYYPLVIQELAIAIFEALASQDPQTVWFQCAQLAPKTTFSFPIKQNIMSATSIQNMTSYQLPVCLESDPSFQSKTQSTRLDSHFLFNQRMQMLSQYRNTQTDSTHSNSLYENNVHKLLHFIHALPQQNVSLF